jgi:ribosomal-protein-alanine N-acetyltransferase
VSAVRAASAADLPALLELDAACFERPWSPGAWREELARSAVLVAGAPVLALACAPIILEVCELRRIAVSPAARRSGLARSLLGALIDHARRHGCERIELEVAAGNVAARELYRAHGFCTVGRRVAYYRDPPDDALLLNLELRSQS